MKEYASGIHASGNFFPAFQALASHIKQRMTYPRIDA